MMLNNTLYRRFMLMLLSVFFFLSAHGIYAQQWQLEPEMSFAVFSTGLPLADSAIRGYQLLQARNGAYFQLGYGLRLQRDYYLLIPERESALQLFGGFEQFSLTGSDDLSREINRGYIRLGIDQVLAGDRVRENRYLMVSLYNTSRWVVPRPIPGGDNTMDTFFTHTPNLKLSFALAERPDFWQILGISGSVGSSLESGHSLAGDSWAYLTGQADLDFFIPLIGRWLYLAAGSRAGADLYDFTPGAEYPQWYYSGDRSPAWIYGQLDVKSRVLRTNPIIPIGLEIGAGVSSRIQADSIPALDISGAEPVVSFFADLAVDSNPIFAFRIRSGFNWNPQSGDLGFFIAGM
ncbi:hypothetical protein [Spirochaeta dissipatitropha]